ncbi:MAG: heavy metal-binding domain-containing protein, partial [Candidatus Deferrimicrobiaceae bacterium]
MSKGTQAHHRSDPEEEPVEAPSNRMDPVCGMEVEENSTHRFSLDGEEYLFCSPHCRETFRQNPGRYLEDQGVGHEPSSEGREEPRKSVPGREYTCPMHPEIRQEGAGDCPKCGMALEPTQAAGPITRTRYTCPMHPEVVQEGPGSCPKCGMALEPMTVTDEEEEDPELGSM